jgi:hypothetical protein
MRQPSSISVTQTRDAPTFLNQHYNAYLPSSYCLKGGKLISSFSRKCDSKCETCELNFRSTKCMISYFTWRQLSYAWYFILVMVPHRLWRIGHNIRIGHLLYLGFGPWLRLKVSVTCFRFCMFFFLCSANVKVISCIPKLWCCNLSKIRNTFCSLQMTSKKQHNVSWFFLSWSPCTCHNLQQQQ